MSKSTEVEAAVIPAVTPQPQNKPAEQPTHFMVHEHITPSTKRHPGAQMQYVAKRFYVADEFLTALWRDGDPCIVPYVPTGKE